MNLRKAGYILVSALIVMYSAGSAFSQDKETAKDKKPEPIKPITTTKIESKETPAPAAGEQAAPSDKSKIVEPEISAPTAQPAPKKSYIIPEDLSTLKESPDKGVIADVNGRKVKKEDLEKQLAMLMLDYKDYPAELKKSVAQSLRKQAIEFLVINELVMTEAEKRKISATDEDIKAEMDKFMGTIKGGKPAFDEILKKYNVTEEEFINRLRKEMTIKLTMKELSKSESEIPESKAKEFFDKNPDYFKVPEQARISHILVAVTDKNSEAEKAEKKKKAESLLKDIKGGADFAATAEKESDCPSKKKGGDLGYQIKEKDHVEGLRIPFLPKKMEEALFSLEKDKVYDGIIEDEAGFHIIKCTDKVQAQEPVFDDEIKKQILDDMKRENEITQFTTWSDNAAKNAKITIFKEAFQAPEPAATPAAEKNADVKSDKPAETEKEKSVKPEEKKSDKTEELKEKKADKTEKSEEVKPKKEEKAEEKK